ncbi:hypothetical protein [Erwinia tasmaniensis]|uniref:hypothetical protein n=1 Tax=Erwinia tasmaniensis TaxID=338565 RepID=UPI003A4DE872
MEIIRKMGLVLMLILTACHSVGGNRSTAAKNDPPESGPSIFLRHYVKRPARHIIFCRGSVIDKKVYETHLTIPKPVLEKMLRPGAAP